MALTPLRPQSANRFCGLIVGPSGAGKTSQLRCLCGQDYVDGQWVQTHSSPEKVLVLSAESGLLCVRDLLVAGKLSGFEIRSLQEFQEALRYCQSREFLQEGYQWVFIDSLTEISARCAEDMQRRYPSKADSFKLWGEYLQVMTDIIKTFRDLSAVNVLFTCLVATDKDDMGRRYLVPDIAGSSLKNRLTSYFDEVLFLDRVLMNTGDPNQPVTAPVTVFRTNEPVGLAKDRSGRLDALELPNILEVWKKILS